MYRLIVLILMPALLLTLLAPAAYADDTATNVALGLAAFAVFNQLVGAFQAPSPVHAAPVYVAPPPPQVVIIEPAPQVVVIKRPPVYYAPPPVYYAPSAGYYKHWKKAGPPPWAGYWKKHKKYDD